jgi:4-phospho-D-threonate 3-dehydrogenase / 4-phospho-D-erythronate 3-dehydrogenase
MNTSNQQRPTIAVTIGDPAGVGAEIVLKAIADPETAQLANWEIVGDEAVLSQAAERCGMALPVGHNIRIRDQAMLDPGRPIRSGELHAEYGRAAVQYVREATIMCLRGEAGAIVTAPLNKEAVTLSGMAFSGHTEFIAQLCGARESRMMLASERLKVVHVTTHVPLRVACDATSERILRTIELGYEAMRMLGCRNPRIAVAGLNPHAGEHNLFGSEDRSQIVPAVEAARGKGIDCCGPIPPDTVFLKAYRGTYDLVVAMYHDQGHIPMKLVAFETTVNVSLGIPIVRTSVDHGTAFDIAGRNRADATNMKAAMRLGVEMAINRAAAQERED